MTVWYEDGTSIPHVVSQCCEADIHRRLEGRLWVCNRCDRDDCNPVAQPGERHDRKRNNKKIDDSELLCGDGK